MATKAKLLAEVEQLTEMDVNKMHHIVKLTQQAAKLNNQITSLKGVIECLTKAQVRFTSLAQVLHNEFKREDEEVEQ